MRTLVIGDTHGALKALKQALKRCNFKLKNDFLILLGDYVDEGPESAQLIDFLIRIDKLAKYPPIFIRGNHDVWCEEWLTSGIGKTIWINQGGAATLKSYTRKKDSHIKFFRNLHDFYKDEENRVFVHGGFNSRLGIGHEAYQSDYYWDRDLWQIALLSHNRKHLKKDGTPQSYRFLKHKEIYIGHTATINWNCKPHYLEYLNPAQIFKNGRIIVPMNRCNIWNMDTGAGWNGKLSIMDIDTKEVWQSDFVKALYPGHYY